MSPGLLIVHLEGSSWGTTKGLQSFTCETSLDLMVVAIGFGPDFLHASDPNLGAMASTEAQATSTIPWVARELVVNNGGFPLSHVEDSHTVDTVPAGLGRRE